MRSFKTTYVTNYYCCLFSKRLSEMEVLSFNWCCIPHHCLVDYFRGLSSWIIFLDYIRRTVFCRFRSLSHKHSFTTVSRTELQLSELEWQGRFNPNFKSKLCSTFTGFMSDHCCSSLVFCKTLTTVIAIGWSSRLPRPIAQALRAVCNFRRRTIPRKRHSTVM